MGEYRDPAAGGGCTLRARRERAFGGGAHLRRRGAAGRLGHLNELGTGTSENSVKRKFNFGESDKGEVPRITLLRASVNKLLVDAPNASGWHHAHSVHPAEKRGFARRRKLPCLRSKRRTRPWCAASWKRRPTETWTRRKR